MIWYSPELDEILFLTIAGFVWDSDKGHMGNIVAEYSSNFLFPVELIRNVGWYYIGSF
jgi:hypothetical protein